jgi:hypothetical protein
MSGVSAELVLIHLVLEGAGSIFHEVAAPSGSSEKLDAKLVALAVHATGSEA